MNEMTPRFPVLEPYISGSNSSFSQNVRQQVKVVGLTSLSLISLNSCLPLPFRNRASLISSNDFFDLTSSRYTIFMATVPLRITRSMT